MYVNNLDCCYRLQSGKCGLEGVCHKKTRTKNKILLSDKIDKSFELSNKSAKESAEIFENEYKNQLLEEAKKRNAEPDLALRNAIDGSFKLSGKSAAESAIIFVENNNDNKENPNTKTIGFIQNNKKKLAVATAMGLILAALLPPAIRKQSSNKHKTPVSEYSDVPAYYVRQPIPVQVQPVYYTQPRSGAKIIYSVEATYSPESTYRIKSTISAEAPYPTECIHHADFEPICLEQW